MAASNSEQSLSYVDATEDVRRAAFRDQGNLILNTVGMVALANNKIMEILDTIKVKIEFKSPAKGTVLIKISRRVKKGPAEEGKNTCSFTAFLPPDLLPLIIKMVEQAQSIQSNSSMVQTDFILFNKLISTTLDQLEVSEMALTNSVTDNNKLRKLQGIEPVTRNTFVRNSLNGGGGGGGGKGRRGSATSSLLAKSIESRSDIFYDAETPVAADLSDEFSSDTEDVAAVAVVGGGRGRSGGDEENSSPCDLDKSDSNGDMDDLAVKFSSTNTSSTTATSNTTATSSIASAATTSISFVTRRKALPAPTASMENINLLSILRNNIGKDLSTVTMPIALNEPINLLQKLCEELEYSDLLDKAANCEDQVERLLLISAFAVSGYASSIYRPGRKPFNPLLGETYECVRPDKGFRFVAEKVQEKFIFYTSNHHRSVFRSVIILPSWRAMLRACITGFGKKILSNPNSGANLWSLYQLE